jgi:Mn2+/Fe2+ NRAMP family transporter
MFAFAGPVISLQLAIWTRATGQLTSRAVSIATTLSGIALLAAGQNSTITGTLARQIVMERFLDIRLL